MLPRLTSVTYPRQAREAVAILSAVGKMEAGAGCSNIARTYLISTNKMRAQKSPAHGQAKSGMGGGGVGEGQSNSGNATLSSIPTVSSSRLNEQFGSRGHASNIAGRFNPSAMANGQD